MIGLAQQPYFWTAITVIIAALTLGYTIYRNRSTDLTSQLNSKVNVTEFKEKMNGIKNVVPVQECQEHRQSIEQSFKDIMKRLEAGNKRFTKTEKCLIFLVEKHEPGAAAEMGLYD